MSSKRPAIGGPATRPHMFRGARSRGGDFYQRSVPISGLLQLTKVSKPGAQHMVKSPDDMLCGYRTTTLSAYPKCTREGP